MRHHTSYMKKSGALAAAALLAALSLSACAGGSDSSGSTARTLAELETVTDPPQTSPSSEPVPSGSVTEPGLPETPPEGNMNNLTGLYDLSDEAVGKRPVAVMINNLKQSLPQYGIAAADMIFECPVEGTVTRLMAVYGDMTKIPDVCSVRSCRYYFPIFALSYDAVYVHWGKDETVAKKTLAELEVDRLDGYTNTYIFDRDKERMKRYSSEHTGFYKGSLTESALDRAGIRKEVLPEKNKPAFSFSLSPDKLSDTVCTEMTVPFTASYFSSFSYDGNTDSYLKTHNGDPHIDSSTGQQLSFTNVFVLSTETEIINSSNLLISLDWKGGEGYYVSHGTVVPVLWSKADEYADIVITDRSGKELKVNPGKSYLGFTPKIDGVTYS